MTHKLVVQTPPQFNSVIEKRNDLPVVTKGMKFPEEIGFQDLVLKKDVLHDLRRQFCDGDKVIFEPHKAQDYEKRLILLENYIDSLLRGNLQLEEGGRTIDYTRFICEKENQVNQLERKITYYENNYRDKDTRIKDLENQIARLHKIIIQKNKIIEKNGSYDKDVTNGKEAYTFIDKLETELSRIKKTQNLSVSTLDNTVESWILKLSESSQLRNKLQVGESRLFNENKYRDFVFGRFSEISIKYKTQIDHLSSCYDSVITYDENILKCLDINGSKLDPFFESIFGCFLIGSDYDKYFNECSYTRTVEVPVQDSQTKALIHKLALQIKRLYEKYPSLCKDIDRQLYEYCTQQIIDCIEVDELDRLISIVKYQPQIVRVDNVYAYNSEKNRKVQFHLRILIKALLEEMQKVRKAGFIFDIDEGIFGLLRLQILDLVEVEDILKCYRTVPKIVEVEKVIQKVIEKTVEYPCIKIVEQSCEVPVEVRSCQLYENKIYCPIQKPVIHCLTQEKLVSVGCTTEKVVPVPEICERVCQVVCERPTVVEIDKIICQEVEVPKIIEIQGPERIVQICKTQFIQICREKIVETRACEEIIKLVELCSQKIICVTKEVPKIVEIQRLVTKACPVKEYVESQKIINHVTQRYQPVYLKVEKAVPLCRVQEKIIPCIQIFEKIVPVVERVDCIKEVRITQEIPIYETKIVNCETVRQIPCEKIVEVEKCIDRIVEVPIIQDCIRIHTEYIKEPVIETIETVCHKPVQIHVPFVIYEEKPIEVEKIVNVFCEVPKVIYCTKETFVPYEKIVYQIISCPVIVQKIVEKIVQVPRIIEIQKIVEKIVPVPRIIEKIVEVQKRIEIAVPVCETKIQIEKQYCREQVHSTTEVCVQIDRPVNCYVKVQCPVEVCRQICVIDTITQCKKQIHQICQPPRIVVETRQCPVPMVVEKICTLRTFDNKFVELKQYTCIPVEIEKPVNICKEVIVAVDHCATEIKCVPQFIDKIVQVQIESCPQICEVKCVEQVLRIQKQIQVVENKIPYYNECIVQVECPYEKIVEPIVCVIQKILEVPYYIQKCVDRIVECPKIYTVEQRVEIPYPEPIIVRIDKICPQIITLQKSIQKICDRIVQIPRIIEKIHTERQSCEKVIIQRQVTTEIEKVCERQEVAVIEERLKKVEDIIHVTCETLKCVDRIIERPTEPMIICKDRIMQVPFIVEKIVEKIVVMPQIVEVLKYVHEIIENNEILPSCETLVQEEAYTRLARNMKLEVSKFKTLLSQLKPGNTGLSSQIGAIDTFLVEFEKFMLYPRIRQIIAEKEITKIVQCQKLVKIPVCTSEDAQRNLASSVLIDKLVNELRRFKLANKNMKWELDQDILAIFGSSLDPISKKHGNNYDNVLDEYVRSIHDKFSSGGTWTQQHQIMLKDFINERFDLAFTCRKAKQDAVKYKGLYDSEKQATNRVGDQNDRIRSSFYIFKDIFQVIITEGRRSNHIDQRLENSFKETYKNLESLVTGFALKGAETKKLDPLDYSRISSRIRQQDFLIAKLKEEIQYLTIELGKSQSYVKPTPIDHSDSNVNYKYQIGRLEEQIRDYLEEIEKLNYLVCDHKECEIIIKRLTGQINELRSITQTPKELRGTKHSISNSSPNDNFSSNYKDLSSVGSDVKKVYDGSYKGQQANYSMTSSQYSGNQSGNLKSDHIQSADKVGTSYKPSTGYGGASYRGGIQSYSTGNTQGQNVQGTSSITYGGNSGTTNSYSSGSNAYQPQNYDSQPYGASQSYGSNYAPNYQSTSGQTTSQKKPQDLASSEVRRYERKN